MNVFFMGRSDDMSPKVSAEYKANRKSELLQAAKRVFIRKGYSQATMQDIMSWTGS